MKKIEQAQWKDNFETIDVACACHTCKHYSNSFLHHLFKAKESAGHTLATIHNIAYMNKLLHDYRQKIFGRRFVKMIIQSLINPKIKFAVTLQESAVRKKEKKFIAQGFNTCITLLQAGLLPYATFMTQAAYMTYQDHFIGLDIQLVSQDVMKKMSTLQSPTEIVIIFNIAQVIENVQASTVVLYNIQDPGNLGTLIRTAVAFNVQNVVCVGGADAYQPKVVQATAGTLGFASIFQLTWSEFLQKFKDRQLCGLVVDSGKDALSIKNSILSAWK